MEGGGEGWGGDRRCVPRWLEVSGGKRRGVGADEVHVDGLKCQPVAVVFAISIVTCLCVCDMY